MKTVMNVCRARETQPGGKTYWDRVGVLIMDGDKVSIRLDAIPTGGWDGWLKAFARDEDTARAAAPARRPAAVVEDDDVPF